MWHKDRGTNTCEMVLGGVHTRVHLSKYVSICLLSDLTFVFFRGNPQLTVIPYLHMSSIAVPPPVIRSFLLPTLVFCRCRPTHKVGAQQVPVICPPGMVAGQIIQIPAPAPPSMVQATPTQHASATVAASAVAPTWACGACSYHNSASSPAACQMCGTPRL